MQKAGGGPGTRRHNDTSWINERGRGDVHHKSSFQMMPPTFRGYMDLTACRFTGKIAAVLIVDDPSCSPHEDTDQGKVYIINMNSWSSDDETLVKQALKLRSPTCSWMWCSLGMACRQGLGRPNHVYMQRPNTRARTDEGFGGEIEFSNLHLPAAKCRKCCCSDQCQAWKGDSTSNACAAHNKLMDTLRCYYGFTSFRPGQLKALLPVAQDTFVRMPTGGGKTLCMFLMPLSMSSDAMGIIISPLVGLIRQQVYTLISIFNSKLACTFV